MHVIFAQKNRHALSTVVGVLVKVPVMLPVPTSSTAGNRMTPTHATKKAKRYRYYVSEGITREPRKGYASRRAILRRWCSIA